MDLLSKKCVFSLQIPKALLRKIRLSHVKPFIQIKYEVLSLAYIGMYMHVHQGLDK